MNAFPTVFGLPPDEVEDVIRRAGAAPSLHNAQPWRFRVLPDVIEVHSDPQRRLPIADPDDCELRLGCGAALFNLRVALEHAGVRPLVTLLPRLGGPYLLAAVRSGGRSSRGPEFSRLYEAIPNRRNNRRPFLPTPVPTGHRQDLIRAAQEEKGWLHVMERGQLGALEGLVHRAHRVQMADRRFRDEMARWTGRAAGTVEGVPAQAAGPRPEPQDQWVLRDFSGGQASARVPGKDFEDDPLLVVLCSHHDSVMEDLQAGQALQRVLLTATSLGLVASLLSQVVEVAEVRDELRRLLGGTLYPHALVRVGYGSPARATPRREPRELLIDAVSTG